MTMFMVIQWMKSHASHQQWMYDRERGQQSIASFITNNHDIKEETDEDTETVADEFHKKLRRDSDVVAQT